jgi:hydrogenase maturation factor HypF (carbamoyltransferase family)
MKVTKKKLKDFTVINVDPEDTVMCDFCDEDYTNDNKTTGGFLFSGKAVCPKCAPRMMQSIKKYNEERFIKAIANEGETFKDFVYRMRKTFYK